MKSKNVHECENNFFTTIYLPKLILLCVVIFLYMFDKAVTTFYDYITYYKKNQSKSNKMSNRGENIIFDLEILRHKALYYYDV